MLHYLIYLLFFLSGAAGLIYQQIWVRKLVLIFGNTTYATSSILTAFMGGLALGSYLLGKYVDRVKSPLKLYGYLELGIGASAMLILFLFLPISDTVYVWLYSIVGNQPVVFNIIRFILSIAILIVPTTLMGGTLPVISKYFIKTSAEFGQRVGWLYGFNTLGAVIGAFFTGFFLIYLFGASATLWIAVIINVVVGGIALFLDRPKVIVTPGKTKKEKKKQKDKQTVQDIPSKIRQYDVPTARLVLWLFGIAGFASLAYEVIWTRALIFFISSTTYSFTIILTTFLVGIALGSFLMAKWVDRLKHLLLWFSLFEIIIAIAAILTIPLLMNLASIQNLLLGIFEPNSWTQFSILLFSSAFLILIIPTLCMGAVFPIVNRIYVESIDKIGRGDFAIGWFECQHFDSGIYEPGDCTCDFLL
ncbi:MAG: fused MFS/spermidine synthase [bacterium]|nr:fused MFS/spermidine synthase [bacterium]